jgi:hypothetical protein
MPKLAVHIADMLYKPGEVRAALRRLNPELQDAVRGEICRKGRKLRPGKEVLERHSFNTAAGILQYIAERSRAAPNEAAPEEAAPEEAAEMAAGDEAEDEAGEEAGLTDLSHSAFVTDLSREMSRE